MSERPVKITRLRFEHLVEPLGIGTPRPRLSWATETERQGWRQAAYQVEVERDAGPAVASVWVEDGDSVLRPWPFPPLASRERATVRVRVRDTEGETSPWSEGSTVEAGLLSPGDWSAEMITPAWDEDRSTSPPAPLLRRTFTLRERIARARLYVTARGVYEIHLNGTTVGADVLQPGWTSYHHRLRYATHDVTDLVRPGDNAVGAMLGDGWFRGNLPGGVRNFYGDRLGLLLQVEVTYRDGQVERVGTDTGWRGALGAVLASDLYDGETYDARRERDGWDRPAFDDADWSPVEVAGFDPAVLVAPTAPPARRVALVRPVAVTASPSGATLVDFGQNLVGRVRLTVSAERGTTITLRHAEVLEDGELAIRPLRAAKATDRYILRGGGPEVWEPRFTFHGFRYAEIGGGRASWTPATWSRSSAPRISSAPDGSSARTPWSSGCTRTWSGACAATRWRSRPTARSATSGWGGPGTSRSSLRRPPSSPMWAAFWSRGWPTSRPSRRTIAAWCRSSSPTPSAPSCPQRPGATPASSCRG